MTNALRTVARLLTACEGLCKCNVCDPLGLPWHELRREGKHRQLYLAARVSIPRAERVAFRKARARKPLADFYASLGE